MCPIVLTVVDGGEAVALRLLYSTSIVHSTRLCMCSGRSMAVSRYFF